MRGNLTFTVNLQEVKFQKDETGYWEVIDGKIIPYHEANSFSATFHSTLDSASVHAPQAKQEDNFWNDDRVIEFVTTMKNKNCSVADLEEYKRGERGWCAWMEEKRKAEEKLFDTPQAKQEINEVMVDMDAPLFSLRDILDNSIEVEEEERYKNYYFSKAKLIELAKQKMKQ